MKIIDRIKHGISVGGYMIKLNFKGQMEYPSFLIGWFLANAMQFAVGVGTLWVIATQFGGINGWGFEEMAFMYGLGILAHALSVIIYIQTWYLGEIIIGGDLDRMLLRPMNVYFQFCVMDFNLVGITDLLPGIIVFVYGATAVGFSWSALNVIFIMCIVAGATMIRGGIYTIVGATSFWTKKSRGLIDVINDLLGRSIMYPMTIYNWAVQGIFTFILPLGFLAFYPAADFLGQDTGFAIPGPIPIWTLLIGIVMMSLGKALFNRGLKRYDSAGN